MFFTTKMIREREPQKEPVDQFCLYCEEESRATWKIITHEGGEELVCDNHRLFLKKIDFVKSDEEIRWEAEWRIENEYDEQFDEDKYKDIDEWEDLDNWY